MSALGLADEFELPVIVVGALTLGRKRNVPHFRVFKGFPGERKNKLCLHDPYSKPDRILTKAAVLGLCTGRDQFNQGNWIVVVGEHPGGNEKCGVCGGGIPTALNCMRCDFGIPLCLPRLLGCVRDGCGGKAWRSICCPKCGGGAKGSEPLNLP